jgi:hypothetical protein
VVYALSLLAVGLRASCHLYRKGRKGFFSAAVMVPLLKPYWSLDFLMRTLRRGLAVFGAIFLFLHLKHLIIWLRPANFDLLYWIIDQKLHFGVQPNVLLMKMFGENHDLAVLLDWLYIKYFDYKILVCVFFLMELKGRDLADRFFHAYVLVWMLGGLGYLVMPADGPCYSILYRQAVRAELREHVFSFPVEVPDKEYARVYEQARIFTAKGYQERLWNDRRRFLKGERYPGVFYGISAMPSLHVAAVSMIAVFLWQATPLLGCIGIIYGFITFFGSMFLQWHYAVDGYIGFVMALIVSCFALKIPKSKVK